MRKYIIKIIIAFKIDILLSKFRNYIILAEIQRIEKKSGCKINYVCQGFNGVKISSIGGDFSKFFIHPSSHLKSDTFIECSGGVSIGRYFHTGRGLTIFSLNHNYNSDISIPYDDFDLIKPVVIKDFVWCGANVTIVPGVTIGEGVVIAGGTVVTKDVPDYAIIGGNPHKIIKYRDIDKFKRLKDNGNFN
jgi:acetyltransferase-like isoleucine patch superfamily enzyme